MPIPFPEKARAERACGVGVGRDAVPGFNMQGNKDDCDVEQRHDNPDEITEASLVPYKAGHAKTCRDDIKNKRKCDRET
ncbi:hypothetical protein ACFLU6_14625 [Acidobacteriota bacterium]